MVASCAPSPPVAQRTLATGSPSATASASPASTATRPFRCRLPFIRYDTGGAGFLTVPGDAWERDPSGVPGLYSWRFGRWLPVNDVRFISPDGSHYAESEATGDITDVDVATGRRKAFAAATSEYGNAILYYAREGIYFDRIHQGPEDGLWLLNPDSGAIQTIFTDKTVEAVGGYAAWLPDVNPADPKPFSSPEGIEPDQVLRRDLNGGPTVTWFYRPGQIVRVIGFDHDKHPLIAVAFADEPAGSFEVWQVPVANQGRRLYLGRGQVMADSNGIWFADDRGISLYTPDSGLQRVSQVVGQLAGPCGPLQPTSSRS
jgi:peptidoglycan hydrolase-like protein with peptidoglycan-binding domain